MSITPTMPRHHLAGPRLLAAVALAGALLGLAAAPLYADDTELYVGQPGSGPCRRCAPRALPIF